VIAADNYIEFDLADFIAKFDGRNVLMAVHDVGEKNRACEIGKACQVGLVILEGNKVIRLEEKPPVATSSIIATGIYIFPLRIFPLISQYCRERRGDNLGELISFLLEKEEIEAYPFTRIWADIGDEIMKGKLSV
jgi:NDP-sugar pyrophosphorylase family protein